MISVIIPAYNSAEYIEQCLDSIEAQDISFFEIIVTVDGCKKVLEKLNSIKYKYRNIRIFYSEKNNHGGIAINSVVEYAKYDTLQILSSDDYAKENCLSTAHQAMKENGADVVMFKHHVLTIEREMVDARNHGKGGIMIKKRAFLQVGGYRDYICSWDRDLLQRLEHYKIKKIDDKLVYYRRHALSLTGQHNADSPLRKKYHKEIERNKNVKRISLKKGDFQEINTRIKVYTAIVGDYDKPRSDCIVFTGNDKFQDPKRESNIYAALPHRFLDCDYSIWLAGNVFLKQSPEEVIKKLLGRNYHIAAYKHHRRKCVYEEAKMIIVSDKDKEEIVNEAMYRFRENGFKKNQGLIETGIIVRKHTKEVNTFNEAWFVEMVLGSRRQQLSFNYVLSKFPKIKMNMINENVRHNEFTMLKKHLHLMKESKKGLEKIISKSRSSFIIVTRAWYVEKVPLGRLELMQKYFIDSLDKQTDKDFEVHIICHSSTVHQFVRLNWKGVKYKLVVSDLRDENNPNPIAQADANARAYNPRSNIQARIDIDDWVHPSYITRVKAEFKDGKTRLISFHPTKYIHKTGESYFSQKTYSAKKPSMFLCTYQRKPHVGIYKDWHSRMAEFFPKTRFIKELGICNLVVHDNNLVTKA